MWNTHETKLHISVFNAPLQRGELKNQLDKLLNTNIIRP